MICRQCSKAFNAPSRKTMFCSVRCHLKGSSYKSGTCVIWAGPKSRTGYGIITRRGDIGKIGAHRAAYAEFVGAIPSDMDVCHRCDNPPCVNPDHLFVGTRKDNMQDCKRKGRLKPRWHAGLKPHGSMNPQAKLTEDAVRQIRAEPRGGKKIAQKYGISYLTLRRVRSRKTWMHVD